VAVPGSTVEVAEVVVVVANRTVASQVVVALVAVASAAEVVVDAAALLGAVVVVLVPVPPLKHEENKRSSDTNSNARRCSTRHQWISVHSDRPTMYSTIGLRDWPRSVSLLVQFGRHDGEYGMT